MPPEKDRATATGNLHKKFVKIGSRDMLADRHRHTQTDRHTDKLITILHSPTSADLVT